MAEPSEDAAPVEELHAYGNGPGPSPIPLSPEFEWVSLTAAEASTYRELRILRGDLDFTISVLTGLLDEWDPGGFETDTRDVGRDIHRARWNAALVAYARTFLSGVGQRLDPAIFDVDAADLHAYFMRLRNRHVAHSVSEFEQTGVVIGLAGDDPPTVVGLLDYLSTEQSPGKTRAEELLTLAQLARKALDERLEAERERLLAYARSIVEDLTKRQRIEEIPASAFGDEVRVRRTGPQ